MAEPEASPKKARLEPTLGTPSLGDEFVALEGEEVTTDADAEADALLEYDLRSAQAELDEETEKMLEQVRQLEHDCNVRKRPLYLKRADVIRQIPGFWLHCFTQHEEIKHMLGAVDQDILSSLTELEVEPFSDVRSGYTIVLRFAENEFFSDRELTKEIRFEYEAGQPVLCAVLGCSPQWKTEDPTNPESIKTGRKRGRDSIAFFRWFTQPNVLEPGLIDTLAEIIKEQLWVNPLEFMDEEDHAAGGGEVAGEEEEEGEEWGEEDEGAVGGAAEDPEQWEAGGEENEEENLGLAEEEVYEDLLDDYEDYPEEEEEVDAAGFEGDLVGEGDPPPEGASSLLERGGEQVAPGSAE